MPVADATNPLGKHRSKAQASVCLTRGVQKGQTATRWTPRTMVHFSLVSWTLAAGGFVTFAAAAKPCVIPHSPGKDDSPAILATFQKCAKDSTIEFAEPIEYNMWTPLSLVGLC